MIKIAPSILAADFGNLQNQIALIEQAGADYLHLDIMDGHFVPNLTMGPPVVASLRAQSNLLFDAHLMVTHPEAFLVPFAQAGADIITVHLETGFHLHRTLSSIRELGLKAGLALNPATPVALAEDLMDQVDMFLIMSVNPGFGGQAFIENSLKKIAQLRQMAGPDKDIQVDGGINRETAARVIEAGANILVAGTAVFQAADPAEEIQFLKSLQPEKI